MIILLTGNIAAGKSSVSGILRKLGAEVIDADSVYHDLTVSGGGLVSILAEEFGNAILDDDGGLDRMALGKIVFGDSDALKRLNELTHPAVISEIMNRMCGFSLRDVVVEIPLLFEEGCMIKADFIWAVDADVSVRLERLMKRNGLSEDEALMRINSQRPIDIGRCDAVIDNSGDSEELEKKVKDLFSYVRKNERAGL